MKLRLPVFFVYKMSTIFGSMSIVGVDMSSGSLGQGISAAVGIAHTCCRYVCTHCGDCGKADAKTYTTHRRKI